MFATLSGVDVRELLRNPWLDTMSNMDWVEEIKILSKHRRSGETFILRDLVNLDAWEALPVVTRNEIGRLFKEHADFTIVEYLGYTPDGDRRTKYRRR